MLDERLERILRRVQRPGRYTGGEWNAPARDPQSVAAAMALCYPDSYEVGMSSYALHLICDAVNSDPRYMCARAFTPWPDMAQALRAEGMPLFTIDGHGPVRDCQVICFPLEDRLAYPDVLEMLDLAGVPVSSQERDESHPLVVGCGAMTGNPEPLARFIDLFVLGDAEETLLQVLALAAPGTRERSSRGKGARSKASARRSLLERAAQVPGLYAPSLYPGAYQAMPGDASPRVRASRVSSLGAPPARPIVPHLEVIRDHGMLEVQRGCGPGCRSCEVGLPCPHVRHRPAEQVVDGFDSLVNNCGYQEVSFLATGAVDLDRMERALRAIRAKYPPDDVAIDLGAMPVTPRSVAITDSLAGANKRRSYLLDIGAATERLRDVIGRPLAQEAVLTVAESAFKRGWDGVRYQLAVGLPGETMEDVQAMVSLAVETQRLGQRVLGRRAKVRVQCSIFAPVPHTLLERAPMDSVESLGAKLEALKRGLKKAGAHASLPEVDSALVEAALARGGRETGEVIERVWRLGYQVSHRSQRSDVSKWLQAFQECGLDPTALARSAPAASEPLAWGHLDFGPTIAALLAGAEKEPAAAKP